MPIQPGADGAPGEAILLAGQAIGKGLAGDELDPLAHRLAWGVVDGMQYPQP
jgi:hypothetical protein